MYLKLAAALSLQLANILSHGGRQFPPTEQTSVSLSHTKSASTLDLLDKGNGVQGSLHGPIPPGKHIHALQPETTRKHLHSPPSNPFTAISFTSSSSSLASTSIRAADPQPSNLAAKPWKYRVILGRLLLHLRVVALSASSSRCFWGWEVLMAWLVCDLW